MGHRQSHEISEQNVSSVIAGKEAKKRKEWDLFWNLVGKALGACPIPDLPAIAIHYRPLKVLYLERSDQPETSHVPKFKATRADLKVFATDELLPHLESKPEPVHNRKLVRERSTEIAIGLKACNVGAHIGLGWCTVDELEITDWTYEHINTTVTWRDIDDLFRNNIRGTQALMYGDRDSDRHVFAVITASHVARLERRSRKTKEGGTGADIPAGPAGIFARFRRNTRIEQSERGVLGVEAQCFVMRKTGDDQWEASNGVPVNTLEDSSMGYGAILLLYDEKEDGILMFRDVPGFPAGADVFVGPYQCQVPVQILSAARHHVIGADGGAGNGVYSILCILFNAMRCFSCCLLILSILSQIHSWVRSTEPVYIMSHKASVTSISFTVYDFVCWSKPLGRSNALMRALFASLLMPVHVHGQSATKEPLGAMDTATLEFTVLVLCVIHSFLFHPSSTDGLTAGKQNALAAIRAMIKQNPLGITVLPRDPCIMYNKSFDKWVFHDTKESIEAFQDLAHKIREWNLNLYILRGHTAVVTSCAVFANDTQVISGSGDMTLRVWDLTDRKELFTLQGHTETVYCCAVFANDTRVISGSHDNTLKVWDLTDGQELFTLQGHTAEVWCCAVYANDTRVISGSWDNTLKGWDLTNGQELFTLQGHTGYVNCCAVYANDTRVISGSNDKTLKVWDLTNGQELFTLQGHTSLVSCCAVFANDTRVISGSWDTTLKGWDLTNGKELYTLQGHTSLVSCCAVFANDTRVISGSWDSTLKVWDLTNGQELYTLQGHTGLVYCCAVFANDTQVISGSYDNTLRVWSLPSTIDK